MYNLMTPGKWKRIKIVLVTLVISQWVLITVLYYDLI